MQASQDVLQLLQQHGLAAKKLAGGSTASGSALEQLPGQDAPALLPLLQRWGVQHGRLTYLVAEHVALNLWSVSDTLGQ
jgi:hypothetical protein